MNDEPTSRRTIIGSFPSGSEIVAFAPVEAAMIADAERRLDEARAERERIAHQTLVVNREFFLQVVHELDRALESERARAARRGAYDRAHNIAGKLRSLHEGVVETLNGKVTP